MDATTPDPDELSTDDPGADHEEELSSFEEADVTEGAEGADRESAEAPKISLAAHLGEPSVADGVRRKLDPAWITSQRISGFVVAFILIGSLGIAAIALGVAFDFLLLTLALWSLLSTLLVVRAWVWPRLAWKYAAYAVSPRGLRLRRGVLFRSIASVPKSRVQHTDVSQGPVQRHFGIATLTVHTAGTQYAAVPVPGLPRETALAIRNFLIDDDEDDDGV